MKALENTQRENDNPYRKVSKTKDSRLDQLPKASCTLPGVQVPAQNGICMDISRFISIRAISEQRCDVSLLLILQAQG